MTTLPRDFKEFIELLNRNNVRYIVIGGYAVVYHGYVRSTNDIDIWIDIREDNIKKLIKVLDEFGFSSLNIKEADFLPNQIIYKFKWQNSEEIIQSQVQQEVE